jgi:hypothetical protein
MEARARVTRIDSSSRRPLSECACSSAREQDGGTLRFLNDHETQGSSPLLPPQRTKRALGTPVRQLKKTLAHGRGFGMTVTVYVFEILSSAETFPDLAKTHSELTTMGLSNKSSLF